jgi:predicted nucleotidyltransferase
MTVAGLIAEYNPLHNGHAVLIREMRLRGADAVAVVMSGNFVQRGEPAILSKWARTEQALASGADLVVELPLPWAVAGAESFALGGVAILTALGADVIGFGSECGNIDKLRLAQKALSSAGLHDAMQNSLRKGATFAAARQQAVESLFGSETALLLREPNNILGIEYLKAIERLGSGLMPVTIRRENSIIQKGKFAGKPLTSSTVRAMIRSGEDFTESVPEASYRILEREIAAGRAPAGIAPVERGVLAVLRRETREELTHLPDVSEGLENRLFTAVQKAESLPELLQLMKTKRYPMARIRRIVLSAFLGVKSSHTSGTPPYLRVLGIGENGAVILRRAGERKMLPIVSRSTKLDRLQGRSAELLALESRATDLYALCMPRPGPCGLDRSTKLVVL